MFRMSPTFLGCPQHFQDVPNIFRMSPTFSGCPQHFQDVPNIFRILSTFHDFPNIFRILPTFSDLSQHLQIRPNKFRFYRAPWGPIGPDMGPYIGPYVGPYFPFVGCPIFALWAALCSLFGLWGPCFQVHLARPHEAYYTLKKPDLSFPSWNQRPFIEIHSQTPPRILDLAVQGK